MLTGTPLSGIIHREDFTRGELRVWVQAEDRNGSAKSQDASFHTADISEFVLHVHNITIMRLHTGKKLILTFVIFHLILLLCLCC